MQLNILENTIKKNERRDSIKNVINQRGRLGKFKLDVCSYLNRIFKNNTRHFESVPG